MASGYEATIWNYLMVRIGNEYGVAAMMGNLQAESGLYPDIVQGDIPRSSFSVEYTAKVDNGTISEYDFVYNGPNGGGYGLAQWTFWSRKQALYDRYKSNAGYTSIGAINLALDFLWYELQNTFPTVLNVLKTANDLRTASDTVLHDFEAPADQSVTVEIERYNLSVGFYNQFSGSTPIDPNPDIPNPDIPNPDGPGTATKTKRKKYNFLLMNAQRRRQKWIRRNF